MRVKSGIRRVVNVSLLPVGARVVSLRENERADARRRELVDALYAVYAGAVLPSLEDRAGRGDLLQELQGTQVPEAMYLLHYLQRALRSGSGDVVEMGVAQGATSALLANELLDDDRQLWLYDSFEGLSAPTAEDILIDDIEGLGTMGAYAGAMANPEASVRNRLDKVGFPAQRLRVVKGFVDESMPVPDEVAFAYLDFDLYAPMLTGLRMLAPRTRTGSVLMIDDYQFFSTGVEQAVSEFLAAEPKLPTRGGTAIRRQVLRTGPGGGRRRLTGC